MTNIITTVKLQSPNYAKRTVEDADISSGDATLTSDNANFSSSDVGEDVIVHGAGSGGDDGQDLVTTISSRTSSTEVELNDTASSSVTDNFCRIGTNGREILLPVEQASYQGQSLADSIPLFNGETLNLDLGQLERGVQLGGSLTDGFATNHHHVSPLYMRDLIRGTREKFQSVVTDRFSAESAPNGTNTNWDDAQLASDEQDSGTARSTGTMRLIFDLERTGNGGTQNYFLYGTVGRYTFQRRGSSFRGPFSYGLTFQPSSVAAAST